MEINLPDWLPEPPDEYKLWQEYGNQYWIVLKVWQNKYRISVLSERQNHRCCWCGERTNNTPNSRKQASVEHVLPRAHGGTDDMDNLVMACRSCNTKRADKMEYEGIDILSECLS